MVLSLINKKQSFLIMPLLIFFIFVDIGFAKVIVCFRYDGISNNSESTIYNMVLKEFSERNIPLTAAIIPFSMSSFNEQKMSQFKLDKGSILKKTVDSGIAEIALNGFSNEVNSYDINGIKSEFSFIEHSKQLEMINKGKLLLEVIFDKEIVTLVSPFESYDQNTLLALEETGFTILSGKRNGTITTNSNLCFLPTVCRTMNLIETVRTAKHYEFLDPIVINVIRESDFMESTKTDYNALKRSITSFQLVLDYLTSQDDIDIMSISTIAKEYPHVKKELLNLNNLYQSQAVPQMFIPLSISMKKIIPPRNLYYLKIDKALSIKKTYKYMVFIINAVSVLFFILVGFFTFKFIVWETISRGFINLHFYRIVSISSFFIVVSYSIRDGTIELIGLMIIFFYLGILLGEIDILKKKMKIL